MTDEKDYILNPRDEDGYRSIHLIYKYRNRSASEYDGLRIELQIRTRLQHFWATAVETMGTLLGQALKSRQGDQEWLDFFALISSAFAIEEGCTPIPRFAQLSNQATDAAVAAAEERLGALTMMRGLSAAATVIYRKRSPRMRRGFYHLIILDSLKRTVRITPYDRDNFKQAVAAYASVEAEAAKGARIEPVLVSAGPMDKLRRAYPNFFLDIVDFAAKVNRMCQRARK